MTPVGPETSRLGRHSATPRLASVLALTLALVALVWADLLTLARIGFSMRHGLWLITVEALLLLVLLRVIQRDLARSAALKVQNLALELRQEELLAQQQELEDTAQELAAAKVRWKHASHRFEELYQSLPVPCYCYNEDGQIFEWNRAFESCFGRTGTQVFQKTVWDVTGMPHDKMLLQAIVAGVFRGEAHDGWEQTLTLPDGAQRFLLCRAFPLRDHEGQITGGINACLDVTERRQAEEKYRAIYENAAEGIFRTSPEGVVLGANPALVRMFGCETEQELLAVRDIAQQLYAHAEERERFKQMLTQHGTVTAFEVEMRHRSGALLWVSANARVHHGADGRIAYYEGMMVNITERKRAEAALRASEERLRAFHTITADPTADTAAKITRLLQLGCREFGMEMGLVAALTADQYQVRYAVSPDDAVPQDFVSSRTDTLCAEAVRLGQPLAIAHVSESAWRAHPAAQIFGVDAYLGLPLRVAGADWGALCFASLMPRADFTESEQDLLRLMGQWISGELERTQSQQAVSESEERFRSAIEAMQEGFMVQDADGVVLLCNQAVERITGIPVSVMLNHPANRPEWRALRADGSEFPRTEQPTRVALATGQPQQGVVLGIEQRESGRLIWTCMNAAPLYRGGEAMPYAAVLTCTDITEQQQHAAQLAASLEQIRDYSIVLEYQKQELEAQKRALERSNMNLEIANVALESLATLDGLTGLKNHRVFQERLELEMHRALRYDAPLSMILLDVDSFKRYNDTFGHPEGDEVLKAVGRILDEAARETDLTARYGGEEFAVILPDTDGEGARAVAERLRIALTEHQWPLRTITASFGVSTLAPAMPNRTALIAAADTALYRAKAAGRNLVVHISDPLADPSLLQLTTAP